MIQLSIKNSQTGNEAIFEFPERPEEVEHEQYIEFKHDSRKALAFFVEKWGEGTLYEPANFRDYLGLLARAVSGFSGYELNALFELPRGRESENVKHVTSILDENYDFETTKETLYGLFGMIYKVILGYKPKGRKAKTNIFTHTTKDNETFEYEIPFTSTGAFGRELLPTMSVAETSQILEAERIYRDELSQIIEGVSDAEKEYKRDMVKIAVLARRKGRKFPTDLTKIEDYINDTMNELQGLNMVNGLDLCFFLTNTMKF